MGLTAKQIIAMKDIQKCCDAGTGGIGKSLEPSDIHGLCETALEQHAEIEILKEQAEIDKDFIKQYQAQVKSLKARLGAAEKVVNQSLPVVNYTDLDNLCSCVSEYREVLIKYGKLKAETGEFHCMNVEGMKAFDEVHELKAGAGSAARNLQAEKFKPAVTSLKPLTADRADGEETSRRVDVGNEQDSGFTSPATPQACNHQTCPTCRPDSYITRPDGIKRRIV